MCKYTNLKTQQDNQLTPDRLLATQVVGALVSLDCGAGMLDAHARNDVKSTLVPPRSSPTTSKLNSANLSSLNAVWGSSSSNPLG